MQQIKGLIFNVQRYSIHDGPGIRTLVFIKGCPLRCLWCCNPEGQLARPEVMYFRNYCTRCRKCVEVCPAGAIKLRNGDVVFDKNLCNSCGTCVEVCPNNARKLVGMYVTVDDILKEVLKDMKFYARSGGGLTVGGGEPFSQHEFLKELLWKAKEYSIHTAVETSLYTSTNLISGVMKHVDYLFVDIKHIDPVKHMKLTGVSNELILNNIRYVIEEGLIGPKDFVIRIPIIPNVNDDHENLKGISEFISSLKYEVSVELLPYHELGKHKYEALGRDYPLSSLTSVFIPPKEHMIKVIEFLTSLGVRIVNT
ncbi:MAG: glycyl-radical enzyme activating protein [Sulfolobales archaeon]|nr:glycyl-radical enzyme activating protein [Sulfolobales archaeon]MDW7969849.1 glycyl-radical enzyme activating protein [Sulfolobales archaeon]